VRSSTRLTTCAFVERRWLNSASSSSVHTERAPSEYSQCSACLCQQAQSGWNRYHRGVLPAFSTAPGRLATAVDEAPPHRWLRDNFSLLIYARICTIRLHRRPRWFEPNPASSRSVIYGTAVVTPGAHISFLAISRGPPVDRDERRQVDLTRVRNAREGESDAYLRAAHCSLSSFFARCFLRLER
jgi:hypothetical protein